MRAGEALLEAPPRAWEESTEAGTPNLTILAPPVFVPDAPAQELVIVPTPIRIRGRTFLARFGPPVVFALTLAAIYWFWPPS